MKFDYAEVLGLFLELADIMTRRDCGLILAGFRPLPSEREASRMLHRLERRGLVAIRGTRKQSTIQVTPTGRKVTVTAPEAHWDRLWDGKWRVITYDLPMPQRNDRRTLAKELRARNVGWLQQSVWLWPHDVQAILDEIVKAGHLPECFCGFESGRLFLCTDSELVETAWPFDEMFKRQKRYLQHLLATVSAVDRAKDLPSLGRLARIERTAYQHAFSLDPLLPRELNPKAYQGYAVQQRHLEYVAALRRRARELST